MIGKVTVWYMTEEERQDYIKKHPIGPKDEMDKKVPKGTAFADINTLTRNDRSKRTERRF
ncbi:hypothetical protein FZC76_06910 [Sutcliffiella horikoshii]|uniref:Uncharacterized protein n=1 Tax=Sutcliffiella horikoshii TaxID=79883 RepID=A0A5D4SZ08_9BACI|nr:hypothetical protein [Sutcliffiella horikoshii]TYS68670.1 hypothetical protein FZC76_06910 [Sutcliffiella horikoshii]